MSNTNSEGSKLLSGGGVILFGKIAAMVIQLVLGLLIIRLLSKNDFGVITLSYMVVSLISLFCAPGFETGLPQLLLKAENKNNSKLVSELLGSAAFIIVLLAIFLSVGAVHFRFTIATLLNAPEFPEVFFYFVAIVPALALMIYFAAISRWLEFTWPVMFFQDFFQYSSRLVILIILVLLLKMGLQGVVFSYVSSVFLAVSLFAVWIISKLRLYKLKLTITTIWMLVRHSSALFLINLFGLMIPWVISFQLANIFSPEEVARYSAPLRVSVLISLPIYAISFLYVPVLTRLFLDNKTEEIRGLYDKSTKWLGIASLLVGIVFCFDSGFIVTLLLGHKYLDSKEVLIVLSLAQCVHCSFGPNGQTLIALGGKNVVLKATLAGLFSLFVGMYFFVPEFGALGSSLSVLSYYFINNCLLSFFLYKKIGVVPFNRIYFIVVVTLLFWSLLYKYYIINIHGQYLITHVGYVAFIVLWVFFIVEKSNGISPTERVAIKSLWLKLKIF